MKTTKKITVILGDPHLPDAMKRNGQFNPEDFATIDKLQIALATLKQYQFEYLNNHQRLLSDLALTPPEFVFNLCDEGFKNNPMHELNIPAFLEMLEIPYTGAPPSCLAVCYNKAFVHAIADTLGVPTPLEYYLDPRQQADFKHAFFPALLKPNLGDSSVGINQHAIVHNNEELQHYLQFLSDLLPGMPILVQEYLTGAEYTIGLIGNPGDFTVLPILAIDYSELPPELPPILGYESKWEPDSPYWDHIHYRAATLSSDVKEELIANAMQLFDHLNCRDYARFDFRLDQNGVIKLLEVNPNPSWCWDGKMNLMAGLGGYSYADLLNMFLEAANRRLHR